jgi:hypothetical protein
MSAGYCYDPQTLFYATSQASDRGTCTNNAICLNGNGGDMTGDIFAPKPDVFPPTPTPTQTGATVFVAGGALSAGKGFIESWQLSIQGNTGSYTGNGVPIVIPGPTTTTTIGMTTTTATTINTPTPVPGTTNGGTTTNGTTVNGVTNPGTTNTFTTVSGTTLGLDE